MYAMFETLTAHISSLALLLALLVLTAGCELAPLEEPLPSFEELIAEFNVQPAGQGVLRDGNRPAVRTDAVHFMTGSDFSTIWIRLRSLEGEVESVALSLSIVRGRSSDLVDGYESSVGVHYGGFGCTGTGSGKLKVVSAQDGLVDLVFVGDVSSRTLVPCFRRVRGRASAVLVDPPL